MMNKFMFLTTYGLKKKFKSKSFIISNIILFILLIAIINIDGIINFFGGDFNEEVKIYVVDNTNESYDIFKSNFDNINKDLFNDAEDDSNNNSLILSDLNIEELKENIKENSDIIVEINPDSNNYLKASIISDGYIDSFTYQAIVQSLNNTKYSLALENSNIDKDELNNIANPPSIERLILDEGKNSEEENMNTIMSVVFPTIILPFFMLILLLIQLIGGEINEEKTTRSMEVIISNVSCKVHFFSKLLANNLFVIIQAVLIFLYSCIGIFIRNIFGAKISSSLTGGVNDIVSSISESGIASKLGYIIPITIVLMILSFVAYSLLAGVLASMTVNVEDYQQVQVPIIIICLISYYLAVMAGMFEGSVFIRFLSYVPLISCLLSPALLVIGQIGIIDAIISIVVMILFIAVLTKYGLRIYKIGILNYSTDKMWTKIFKAVRKN